MIDLIKKYWEKKFVKDAVSLYVSRSINLFLGLISTLFYGIIFQSTEIAVLNLFEMMTNFFLSFGFTWSTMGVIRYGAEEYHKYNRLCYTSSIRLIIISPILILSILILILFRASAVEYIGTKDFSIYIFLILEVALLVFHEHITTVLTSVEKHVWNALYFLFLSIGKFSLLLLFYLRLFDTSPEFYIKISTYFSAGLILFRIIPIKKEYLFPLQLAHKKDIVEFLKFVLPQIYGFAGLYLINWMDVYFIRKYCSLSELGAYQFLYTIFLKFTTLAVILNALFFPRVIYWKNHDEPKLNQYLNKAPLLILFSMVLGIGLILAVYRPIFSVFFKNKYVVAYSSFNIILASVPFFFVTRIWIPVLNAYDRVAYIQIVNIISALTNLALDFFLIKKIGIIGGALGTFVAYLIKYILLMIAVKRMFAVNYRLDILITVITSILVGCYFLSKNFL